MVWDAVGDGDGDGVTLTAGAGSAVPFDSSEGEGEGDGGLCTDSALGVADIVGAGLESTAKAGPLRPGPVNKEQARVMSPNDFRTGRRD